MCKIQALYEIYYTIFILQITTMELKKKDVRAKYPIMFWYCDINYILKYFERVGYTAWIYWWNEDIYCINGTWISTWYRPTGERPNNEKDWLKYNEYLKDHDDFTQPREKRKNKVHKKVLKLLENI